MRSAIKQNAAVRRIEAAMAADDAQQAVLDYYDIRHAVPAVPMIEWALARYLSCTSRPLNFPVDWPVEVLNRVSGAALVFVGAQTAGVDIRFPDALAAGRTVPMKHRRYIARAWLSRPECECLSDIRIRRPFVEMLAGDVASMEFCVLAEASRPDADTRLLNHLCAQWTNTGVYGELEIDILKDWLAVNRNLDSIVRKVVAKAIHHETVNDINLLKLLEIAFNLRDLKTVARYAGRLIDRPLPEKLKKQILVIYLASLPETGAVSKAAELYETRWRSSGWAYPFPEKLLYGFQILGARDLEDHLCETAIFNEKTPAWARLSRETRLSPNPERHLRAWADLYSQEIRDERVLAGFTKALLKYPEFESGKWRSELIRRWERLCAYDAYRETASAYLVLLHPTNEEKIRIFETHLYGPGVVTPLVGQAIRAYIKALGKRKRWNDLRGFLVDGAAGELKHACLVDDIRFIRLMADLETIPEDVKSFRSWRRKWEQIIGLPLDTEMLMDAADHFIRLKGRLFSKGGEYRNNDHFEDVSLQFLRRIKAEAEKILKRAGLPDEETETYRSRLKTASFEGTYRILTELTPYL